MPQRIGTYKRGKTNCGDAGYGLEEFVSGGRMFHEIGAGAEAFEMSTLTLQKKVRREKRSVWRIFEIDDAFVNGAKTCLDHYKPADNYLTDCKAKKSKHNKGATLYFPSHGFVEKNSMMFNPTCCTVSSNKRKA